MQSFLLFIHFLGLAMGVGFSITMAVQSAIADKMPPEVGGPAMGVASRAAVLGPIGLVLMIGSGIALTFSEAMPIDPGSTGFMVKMALVVLLTGLIIGAQYNGIKLQKTAQSGPPDPVLAGKASTFGKFALLTSLLTMITAVTIFN